MEPNISRVLNTGVRHPLNGILYKYTNVVKGWQYRWFTVDPRTGILSYYLYDSSTIVGEDVPPPSHILNAAPRGQVHLAGAVVCPSDEDSKTFSIGCASGDTLKLRAVDARARQEWVDGLRAIVESHTKAIEISNSSPLPAREILAASDAMVSARQSLYYTEQSNVMLARAIEAVESAEGEEGLTSNDPDLLMLKAISTASTQCLHQCLGLLQRPEEVETSVTPSTTTVK